MFATPRQVETQTDVRICQMSAPARIRLCAAWMGILLQLSTVTVMWAQNPSSQREKPYTPSELDIADPTVKPLADAAESAMKAGNFEEGLASLEKALHAAESQRALSDKAILEGRIGLYFFVRGRLDDAKSQFLSSLTDAITVSNLVLQVEVLSRISTLQQLNGHADDALRTAQEAVALARRSRNVYEESQSLGELGRLQIISGKREEAKASVEQALQIDRVNQYECEAVHLLYLANLNVAESKTGEAFRLGAAARDLAIKNESYLTFLQASLFLGMGYVSTGRLNEGIRILELTRKGQSDQNKPLFRSTEDYERAVSLPYLEISFLETLASAYEAASRPDDALKRWQEMYDISHKSGFAAAMLESARHLGDLYRGKHDFKNAITYYALAVEAATNAGNEQARAEDLAMEASLLLQGGDKRGARAVNEKLLPLAKSTKNVRLQAFTDLVIAELLDGEDDRARVEEALADAKPLFDQYPDKRVIEPTFVVEFYLRLADLAERQKDTTRELVSLERALDPAISIATAQKGDAKPLALVLQRLRAKLMEYKIRDVTEKDYSAGRLADALAHLEILQYFEEIDASAKGEFQGYQKNLDKDPILNKLRQLPAKILAQDNGADILAKNLEIFGYVANRVRPLILGMLTAYSVSHQNPVAAVDYARQALSLGKGQENAWVVAISCELATALVLAGDPTGAVEALPACMQGAKKLGDPGVLNAAHQTNVIVLEATGRLGEAQESIKYLSGQKQEDPQQSVQLAVFKAQQGDHAGALTAWQEAIKRFEARGELGGAAYAHLQLADLLSGSGGGAQSSDQVRSHLEKAETLYQQVGSREGQVNAEIALGGYYATHKDKKPEKVLAHALELAREADRRDLEAGVLAQMGKIAAANGDWEGAVRDCKRSAELYHSTEYRVDEANQLQALATALNHVGESDKALEVLLQAESVADSGVVWVAKYWIRRALASAYENQGSYELAVTVLRQAKQIADSAKQPLNSAWASIDLATCLEVIGDWQEAAEQIKSTIPVFKEVNDQGNEALAYGLLMGVYGSRESDLKDLPKALDYYQLAHQTISSINPEQAATLDAELVEIYWNGGRFRDAIEKAQKTLEYFRKTHNEFGQASMLISLAEAQRSAGKLDLASRSLSAAEPLVARANNFYTQGRLYYNRAALLRDEGKLAESVREYERVVAMIEQIKAGSNTQNRRSLTEHYGFIYDELIDACYRLSRTAASQMRVAAGQALEYEESNKARAFADAWGNAFIDALRRRVPSGLQDQERTLSKNYQALEFELQQSISGSGRRSPETIRKDLAENRQRQSDFEGALRHDSPAYAEIRYPRRIGISDVPLRPREFLIQLKVLDHETLVWMLSGTEKGASLYAFYKVDRPKGWFSSRVFRMRDAFNTGHPEQFDTGTTDELLHAIFRASDIGILQKAKTLIFIPDGVLFLLPFEMLTDKGNYVFRATPTEYFPSTAALRLARTSLQGNTEWRAPFIGLADPITSSDDPRYQAIRGLTDSKQDESTGKQEKVDKITARGFSLERLPATADEVRNIAALFHGGSASPEIRTGIDATKGELLETDLSQYRFVHFATHGILPVESGMREPVLVLSYDGKSRDDMLLSLSEVLALRLKAEMVVLSACNTGSGKVNRAEGVASLGTAFLAAGASSVTVSLWQVADTSTAELMAEFYKNIVSGQRKAVALAEARVALSQKNDNPFFWAPFILTGE